MCDGPEAARIGEGCRLACVNEAIIRDGAAVVVCAQSGDVVAFQGGNRVTELAPESKL